MSRLTIRGRILLEGKVVESAVVIENGVITAIGKNPGEAGGDTLELGEKQILIPAGIDLAAHYRDWDQAYKETVETGTRAAVAGGITTVCDMPNTLPRVNTVENIKRRVKLFEDTSYCDFAIHAMPPFFSAADVERFEDYKPAGAFAIHLFPWDIPIWNLSKQFDPLPPKIKEWVKLGLQGSVHAEEEAMRNTPLEVVGETYALPAMLNRLDPEWRVRFKTSRASSVPLLNDAKKKYPHLLVQTSPQYLFMSQEQATRKIGIAGENAPVFGDEQNRAELEDLLRQGAFDVCVSDHFPHRITDKFRDENVRDEFWPKRGFSALDYIYPLLLSRAGLAEGTRLFAENPAKVLGLKRGKIAKGYDADVVVLEEGDFLIVPDEFESKAKVTPFAGDDIPYRVKKTFMRGVEVFDAGKASERYTSGGPRTFNKIPIRRIA